MARKKTKKICSRKGGIIVPNYERNNYDSDKRNDGIHAKDFVIGAVTGAIIGSLAAFLFAPKLEENYVRKLIIKLIPSRIEQITFAVRLLTRGANFPQR